jgi:hypothetical protein
MSSMARQRLLLFDHANHRAQHLLQRCGIVWQVRKVDLHARRMIGTIASRVMNPA